MKTFIGITGTTSVGKSSVAVELAKMLDSEVVSADSMQVYKGMDIGTAKITESEMCGIKHHMLSVVEPNVNYSSFLYQESASKIIDNLKMPIVAGGTGFYFDGLIYPPEFGNVNTGRRLELNCIYKEKGLDELCQLLKELDPKTFENIDCKNPKRVIRAIEIAESGRKKSEGLVRNNPRYKCILFVLYRNRESLYAQIDERVDNMIKNGLISEVKSLVERYGYLDNSAFSAIGYKEIITYLRGKTSLEEAIRQIKLNTRHYSKRQITYYKKMAVEEYVDVDSKTPAEVATHIYDRLKDVYYKV